MRAIRTTLRLGVMLSALLASGCLKLDQVLTLEKDGSGRFEVTYALSEQTIEQLRAIYKLREDLDEAAGSQTNFTLGQRFLRLFLDPEEAAVRKELAKYERYGVAVEKLSVESRGAARTVSIKLRFDSLADVAQSDLFKQYGFDLAPNADGDYVLSRPPMDTSPLPQVRYSDDEATKILSPVLSGFRVTLTVKTPGAIRATNAPRRSLRSAEWVFDFSDDPYALRTLQRFRPRVIFSGRGDVKLPEVKVARPAAGSS